MNLLYWILCFIIGLIPALSIYFLKDKKKKTKLNWLPAILRFFSFFLTAILLLAPAFTSIQSEEEKPLLIWLHDNSTSMKRSLNKDSIDFRNNFNALKAKWSKDFDLIPQGFGDKLVNADSMFSYAENTTDISFALQAVMEMYRERNVGAIILSTDGIYNAGLNPQYIPTLPAIPLYSVAIGDSTIPKDIAVSKVYVNKTVALDNEFEVIVDVQAQKLSNKTTELTIGKGSKILNTQQININGEQFSGSYRFVLNATDKGLQRYTLSVPVIEDEKNIHNNKMDFYVEVIDETIKILLIGTASHPDIGAIKNALKSLPQYKITAVESKFIPANINEYSIIIAHQYPSKNMAASTIPKNIPVWYILGENSHLALFNEIQSTIKITGSGTNHVLPIMQKGFGYFNTPENMGEVIHRMPPLNVPNGNYLTTPSSKSILKQQIGNVITDFPLWLFDLGEDRPTAITLGEGIWRWRLYEFKNFKKHEVVDDLIRQTVNFLAVKKDKRPFKVYMENYIPSDNQPLTLFAELFNLNGELINTPEVKLEIKNEMDGSVFNYTFEKSGNTYSLNIGLLAPGSYTFKGTTSYNNLNYSSEGSFVVNPVPLEDLKTNADYNLLSNLSKKSGGSMIGISDMYLLDSMIKSNDFIKPVLHSYETNRPFIDRRWIFFFILLIAGCEWVLRKFLAF